MGWDVGSHPDGNPRGPVHQEVREAGRQDSRFFFGTVVVVLEINGVLVDVAQHFDGDLAHLSFGVPHGGRPVPIDGAEVTVPVDQHVTVGEVLGHPNEPLVNRRVPVGVKFPHDVPHDPGRLLVGLIRSDPQFVHPV